ncbi:cation-transporting P-type ATPase [Candidatus Uhrbacteria bacterium]|nr:cation-transporting P-type ATPase [Candidatus Uhrbacteria bacterium]
MPSLSPEAIHQPFWAMSAQESLAALQSSDQGLSSAAVQERQKLFGQNVIHERRRSQSFKILVAQFKSPLIILLIIAGIITILFHEWANAIVIFLAVAINAALGFWQEYKAATVLEKLKSYVQTRCRVRRDGQEHEIDAIELVPGDVIRVTQGDRVPADARLLFVNQLEVEEAVLTGESMGVTKTIEPQPTQASLGERTSVVFSGTLVQQGFADAVVTATGGATEFGRIALLASREKEEQTPLQRSVSQFAAWATGILTLLIVVLFFSGVTAGQDVKEMFLIAVAAAVSAVPEGLPIALTVIFAIGVERLAKHRGIVRKLLAAETLGSTSLILTDKTGTLTEGRMTLTGVIPFKGHPSTSSGHSGKEAEALLLQDALLNTDVVIEHADESPDKWQVVGRSMEVALVRGAAERGILLPEVKAQIQVLDRLPFRSDRKYSFSHVQCGKEVCTVLLGAPEMILGFTTLSAEQTQTIFKQILEHASGGARVLGVASKRDGTKTLEQFTFLGLLLFQDPVRASVKEAIHRIQSSGVRVVIVSGDHQGTVAAIGREVGIVTGEHQVMTGEELAALRSDDYAGRLSSITAYARTTPEQKMSLVKFFQSQKEIVAVTGDGVNDAPALQAADIGVAVGSGTDVAKGAADLVILDNNFETIVLAIEEGRRILQNVRKVIVYLLSDGLNELLLIGGSLLLGLAIPINALQILLVNLFADSIPAIAFAFEGGTDSEVTRRRMPATLLDPYTRFLILGLGTIGSAFLFVLYVVLGKMGYPMPIVHTFIFAAFATYTLFLSFSLKNLHKNIWQYHSLFGNRLLNVGVIFGLVLTLSAIYVPFLQVIFKTVALPWPWLLAVIGVGLLNIGGVEMVKRLFRPRAS